MSGAASLEQVIVVPRNGYANRLQAWASAAILAAELDVPYRVLWETEAAAVTDPSLLFSPELIRRTFLGSAAVEALIGGSHEDHPRYLTVDADRRLIVLAGHDRGEQAFMDALPAALADPCRPTTLLIIAGGQYHLPDSGDFARQRRHFYASLQWSDAIDERVAAASAGRTPCVGLHIRQTDRAREAPQSRAISAALDDLRRSCETSSLFIAADTAEAREHWAHVAGAKGFQPWWAPDVDWDRAQESSGVSALVDWRLLAGCEALVYPAASSFSSEAAVASGHADRCIALTAPAHVQRWRARRDFVRSALGYQARQMKARRESPEL